MQWTRVNSDVYGNPRYVVHFLDVMPKSFANVPLEEKYARTVKLLNKIGGKKFTNRQYGGGIVFQSYNIDDTEKAIRNFVRAYDRKNRQG